MAPQKEPRPDEMNRINKLYAGKKGGKKSNLAYCIGRAGNVMVGIVVREVYVTQSHVRRG